MQESFLKRVLTVVAVVTTVTLVLLLLWHAFAVLLLGFAGAILGVVLTWLKQWFSRHLRIPPMLALALVVLLMLGFWIALFSFAIPLIADQVGRLIEELPDHLTSLEGFLERFAWGRTLLRDGLSAEHLLTMFDNIGEEWIERVVGAFSTTLSAVIGLLVVMVIGIYIAAEPKLYTHGILRLVPIPHRDRARTVLARLGTTIRWWLLGQILSMAILGTVTTAGLTLLGVPYAFALGLLTAIMTFIPNLGPMLAFIPTMLVAFAQGPQTALYVFALYIVVQNVEGYFITPLVHRRVIAMPPVLILTVQIILLSMVGFIGVLLAMPLVACAMVLLRTLYVEYTLGDSFDRPA